MYFFYLPILASAFSIYYNDGTNNNYPEIIEWVNSHTPVEISTIADLNPRDLFKAGAVKVLDTNTVIIPDGDFADITSFYDLQSHTGIDYCFSEYDFSHMKVHRQSTFKTLGTGLDNTKSSVANSMSYTVGVTNSLTDSFIFSMSGTFLGGLELGGEFDVASGGGVSEAVTCNASPGEVVTIRAKANVLKLTNVRKRPVIINSYRGISECYKHIKNGHISGCMKHDYGYQILDWQRAEFEVVNRVEVECR